MSCVSLTSCDFYRDPAAATSETQIMSFHFRRIINLKNCSCIHITSVFFQQGSFLCTINLISHQHLNSAKKMEVKWLWSEVLLLGPCTDKETEHKAQTDNKKKMRKEGNQRQQRIFFIVWMWWQKYGGCRWRQRGVDLWVGKRWSETVCVSEGDSWFHRGKENEAAEQPEQRRGLLSDWQVDFSNAAESVVTDKPAW